MVKYNWVFQQYSTLSKSIYTVLDLTGTNGAIIVNTSVVGTVIIRPANLALTPGQKFEFIGNENELFTGKIFVTYSFFPGDILPAFSIIKKVLV